MSTLFISGFNDKGTVKIYPGPDGGTGYKYDGSCGIYGAMNFGKARVDGLTLFGDALEYQKIRIPARVSLVFNEISDPDSHSRSLKRCEELCWKMQLPVINHPSRIFKTTRDNIPILLKHIPGLRVPATISLVPRSPEDIFTGIDREGLAFPVIVRTAGSHGGISSILIRGRDDFDKLHFYAFDGTKFYLTEFVDYVSDDGYYRKYRIVVIDGVPLYRHHLADEQWMIHSSSLKFMKKNEFLIDESVARRERFDEETLPGIRPAIDEMTKRLQLEYYGIDCNIDEQGNILIFEVNANMKILAGNNPLNERQMRRIKHHILKLLDKYPGKSKQQKLTQKG